MSAFRLVMMGTGTFAEPTFEALLRSFPGAIVGLVTQPAREAGRRSGATRQTGRGMGTIAAEHGIPIIQPLSINSHEGRAQLTAWRPDLLVVAAYGQILKPEVLAIPTLGAINVHASLLPKYRGAAPIAHAILNGETETGVTIIRMTPTLDAGEMLAQAAVSIQPEETAGELEQRLAPLGAHLAVQVIERMQAGPVRGTPQDPALVTKAPKIRKTDGLIDWSLPAERISNHVRAMQPWPTAYTFYHRAGKPLIRLAIIRARPHAGEGRSHAGEGHQPGRLSSTPETPLLAATGAGMLNVLTLQIAGKRPMSAAEFLRGYPLTAGACFGPEPA